jgi:tetratricopeptide (TPR) repeat protein
MPFEKAKVLKAAEKFLSQGKINAAIKEYRQIIKHDEDDLTALNMLGDLLARAGDKEEAVTCFTRIAEHYREQDFRLKAIAMYKKIERLKPRDPEIAGKLAELYAAQGLIVDARAQYLIIADAYTKAGETKRTLKILHRIADLDPQNTEVRLKLAEGYLKEGMDGDAAKAYSEAARSLLEKGEFEKALESYSKAAELRPNDRAVLKGLISTHAALGTAEDAAELLEKKSAEDPGDYDLISMLGEAYLQAGDAPGAERVVAQLVAKDQSDYRRYIEVASAYLKSGEASEAARILQLIIEPMLAGREESDLLELVNELLVQDPDNVGGLRLLTRIYWWQRDMEKLRSTLEQLAESAEHAGLNDDERYALTQLVRLAPDEHRFAQRLEELGGSLEEAEPSQLDSSSAPVPEFETFASIESSVEIPPAAVVADEFVWNSVSEEVVNDPSASFADLNEVEFESNSAADPVFADSAPATDVHLDTDVSEDVETDAGKIQAMIQQELESVDFYIKQGYSDIAVDTLEILERQFGSHPEIELRRRKLNLPASSVATEAAKFIASDVAEPVPADSDFEVTFLGAEDVQPEMPEVPVPATTPVHSGIDSGLAEIFEEFRLEAEGDHAEISNEDFETHYNMATAYKEMDLLDEAIREFQTAANLTKPGDSTPRFFQCCNMLGHCFVEKNMPRAAVLWFKKGLDTPGRSSDEFKALQYELGLAYEQMNDLQRALAAFTEVYGLDVGYRDVGDRISELQMRQSEKKKKRER